jgi:epoxide hydrolase-like predicted phosphatase
MIKIEAVVFDFGGVLATFYRADLFRALEERLGMEPGSLSEILWRSSDWRLAEVGAISDEEYWRRTGPRLGLQTAQAIREFQRDLFGDIQPDPRMVELVRWLRGRYRTGLLSNASDALPQALGERYDLDGLFDVVLVSAMVGLAKPDPAIYRLALERLGSAPGATVFVDDYEPNVDAAAVLGIQAIHFQGYEALVPALRQRGVEVNCQ